MNLTQTHCPVFSPLWHLASGRHGWNPPGVLYSMRTWVPLLAVGVRGSRWARVSCCALVSAPAGSRGRGCGPSCLPTKPVATWNTRVRLSDPVQWDYESSFVIRENWDRIDANHDAVYMTVLTTSSAAVIICTIFSTDSSKAWIAEWKPMFMFICHQILHNSTVIYMYLLNFCKQFIFAVEQNILRDRGTICTKIWARVSDIGCRTKLK